MNTKVKLRPDGRVIEVEHHELGRIEGYGPWTCWTLRTADALLDVLGTDYFSNRLDMKAGDMIEAVCGEGGQTTDFVRLIVTSAGPSKPTGHRATPKRSVKVALLHRYGEAGARAGRTAKAPR